MLLVLCSDGTLFEILYEFDAVIIGYIDTSFKQDDEMNLLLDKLFSTIYTNLPDDKLISLFDGDFHSRSKILLIYSRQTCRITGNHVDVVFKD